MAGLYQPEEISQVELATGRPFVINFEGEKVKDFGYLS